MSERLNDPRDKSPREDIKTSADLRSIAANKPINLYKKKNTLKCINSVFGSIQMKMRDHRSQRLAVTEDGAAVAP